jgi:phospholipid N-methyltransferase
MAEEIDGSGRIVEFGSGTGCVTTEILKNLPPSGRLTCFEVNPKFCRHLDRIGDPRLNIINDDAENCEQYIDGLECIVSGLPLTLFAKPKRERILDIAGKSKSYIQLQYTPLLAGKIKSRFAEVKLKCALLNFPPAFIYVCKNSRERAVHG